MWPSSHIRSRTFWPNIAGEVSKRRAIHLARSLETNMGLRAWIDRSGKTAGAILALVALAGLALKAAAWMRGLPLFAWLFVPVPWIAVALATFAVALLVRRVTSMSARLPDIHSLSEPQVLVLRALAFQPRQVVSARDVARATRLSDIGCESAAIQLEKWGLICLISRYPPIYQMTDTGITYVDQHNLGPSP